MANELAFVLINPYTISKSRTGGVIGRFMSRTGLDLAGARLFAPGADLVEKYAALVGGDRALDPEARGLLANYILKNYAPDRKTGLPRRVMMILLEGENAIEKVRQTAGPVVMGSGETIRDTFGDYVVDDEKKVKYFEPAVLIGSGPQDTAATLKLWCSSGMGGSGMLKKAVDVNDSSRQWQQTLVLIKPDNFMFPNARPGNIIDLLSRSGLRIISANVHRISVAQAEKFYQPVHQILREKMKGQISSRVVGLLEKELNVTIPGPTVRLLEDQLGPLLGDEQFYQLIKFMTGHYPPACQPGDRQQDGQSKCLSLIYSGVNAVEKIRNLLSSTDPNKASMVSVRREFGRDIMVNAAHASDSPENAEREIGILDVGADQVSPWIKKYYD